MFENLSRNIIRIHSKIRPAVWTTLHIYSYAILFLASLPHYDVVGKQINRVIVTCRSLFGFACI